jgi:hypothetical protein
VWELGEEKVEQMRKKDEKRRKREYRKRRDMARGEKRPIRPGTEVNSKLGNVEAVHEKDVKVKRKRSNDQMTDDRDAAKILLEQARNRHSVQNVIAARPVEQVETHRGIPPGDEKKRRFKDFVSARELPRYPSLAIRKAAAGKYDLLGI